MSYSEQDLRSAHEARNRKIISLLTRSKEWYEAAPEDSNTIGKAEAFANLIDDVNSGEYSIVLVGEFSAGKSTLLNALMRKRMLPSFKGETTATVNFLRHKERTDSGECGRVYFNDGNSLNLPDTNLRTVEKYASTRGTDVAAKVRHLDLYFDSPFLKDGVTLVDSPGLNGMAERHKEITEQQILNSHAAIFCFSAEHAGGTRSEFDTLRDLKGKSGTILFVINKIDGINTSEGETLEEIITKYESSYKSVFPDDKVPEIWPVAALKALAARDPENCDYHGRTLSGKQELEKSLTESRIEKFESRLLEFLTKGEKTKRQLLEPIDRVKKLIKESKDNLEQEIQVLSGKVDSSEIENQIQAVKETKDTIEQQINKSAHDIMDNVKTAFSEIKEEQSVAFDVFCKKCLNGVDDCDSLDAIGDYISGIGEKITRFGERANVKISEQLRDKLEGIIYSNYSKCAGDIASKLDAIGGSPLGFSISADFSVGEATFKIGLDKMQENERELMKQLAALEGNLNEAETDRHKARRAEREKARLEEQLDELKLRQIVVNDRILPQIHRDIIQDSRKKTFGERGLIGGVLGILFGSSSVAFSREVTDSTERDEATKRRDSELQKLRDEEGKFKAQLGDINSGADSAEAEARMRKLESELEHKRDEITRRSEENRKIIQEQYSRQITKQKRVLRDKFDDIYPEFESKLNTVLKNERQTYSDIVKDVVVGNLQDSLNRENEKLSQLQNKLQESESEKTLHVEKLNQRIETADRILSDAADLETELEQLSINEQEEKVK